MNVLPDRTSQKLFVKLLFILLSFSTFIGSNLVNAQTLPLPYEIINLSEFSDDEIYVGLVGKINVETNGETIATDVWIDMATGDINEMLVSDNTLQGPIHNGNKGPGGEGKYADNFTKLSDIPNNLIDIPHIYAVRIFISFKSPLYLYFFGPDEDGVGGGYSAPSLSNDSDPNLGLKYELIELTYGDNGLWTNTTRVDAYQYPMGLEVWGTDGFYKRVGEVLSHDDILTQWRARVGSAFQGSLDDSLGEGMEIILNPSKSTSFQEGEAYNDYFAGYVDAIWARYEDEDMYLSIGEAGVWRGRVTDDQFIFTNQEDATIGMISAKPNTLEILEASGVLAEDVTSTESIYADQNIQKHFSAAFNRGAIDINAVENELLEWSDLNSYFGDTTHNEYVAFWHSEDISFEGETYAFAYDDVFDYSSTIQSTVPEKVTITIGGFVDDAYVAPTAMVISNDTTSLLSGEETLLSAQLFPIDVDNPAIIWASSDPLVATVTDGLVTALTTGTTEITASSYDKTVAMSISIEVNGGDYSNDSTIRIEAEDYSAMLGVQTQATSDSSGNLNVGWIDVGDYMEYQVTLATAGEYTIAYRISSVVGGSSVDLQLDGTSVLSTTLISTGSWDNWQTQVATLTLPAGDVTLRLVVTGANWNLNWFDLTLNTLDEPIDDNENDDDSNNDSDDLGTEDPVDCTEPDDDSTIIIETDNTPLTSDVSCTITIPVIIDNSGDEIINEPTDSSGTEDNLVIGEENDPDNVENSSGAESDTGGTADDNVEDTAIQNDNDSKSGGSVTFSLLSLFGMLLLRRNKSIHL